MSCRFCFASIVFVILIFCSPEAGSIIKISPILPYAPGYVGLPVSPFWGDLQKLILVKLLTIKATLLLAIPPVAIGSLVVGKGAGIVIGKILALKALQYKTSYDWHDKTLGPFLEKLKYHGDPIMKLVTHPFAQLAKLPLNFLQAKAKSHPHFNTHKRPVYGGNGRPYGGWGWPRSRSTFYSGWAKHSNSPKTKKPEMMQPSRIPHRSKANSQENEKGQRSTYRSRTGPNGIEDQAMSASIVSPWYNFPPENLGFPSSKEVPQIALSSHGSSESSTRTNISRDSVIPGFSAQESENFLEKYFERIKADHPAAANTLIMALRQAYLHTLIDYGISDEKIIPTFVPFPHIPPLNSKSKEISSEESQRSRSSEIRYSSSMTESRGESSESDTELMKAMQQDLFKGAKEYFTLLNTFDNETCFEKLVCDIHTRVNWHREELTPYETNVISVFEVLKTLFTGKPHDEIIAKYFTAAELGEQNLSTEFCQTKYPECHYSAREVMDMGNELDNSSSFRIPNYSQNNFGS